MKVLNSIVVLMAIVICAGSGSVAFADEGNLTGQTVTVDGIDGTIRVPPGAYTGTTFAQALEDRINSIAASDGKTRTGAGS